MCAIFETVVTQAVFANFIVTMFAVLILKKKEVLCCLHVVVLTNSFIWLILASDIICVFCKYKYI